MLAFPRQTDPAPLGHGKSQPTGAVRCYTRGMHIYFSGLGGVGIGPLAEIAHQAGYIVSGSDLARSLMTDQLERQGIAVTIGQDGSQIASAHAKNPIDWFVYTAALPEGHPELIYARDHGIRTSKRDELLAHIIKEKDLKLIAVAGTHGKTTTTGMLVWAAQQLNIPISYSIGTTISFGPSGLYDPKSRYFIYECDEYDRNFLRFHPWASIITAVDHDHIDTYPTENEYYAAFDQFMRQSELVIVWQEDCGDLSQVLGEKNHLHLIDKAQKQSDGSLDSMPLVGQHNRENSYLVKTLLVDHLGVNDARATDILADFPGTDRRMEKLTDNLYSDYGHHPAEIAATLQLARELSNHVVLVYQPHQNTRQHDVRDEYRDSMVLAEKIYWLPTYLTREDESLEVLAPAQLISGLSNSGAAEPAELDDNLWDAIQSHRSAGHLVLVMGAGIIDAWVRDRLTK